ncbi:daunorubicin ABC transporter ATP-binding protein [Candidatus Aerophobetes bacterium Ae_b3a]|nr:MAG: daunorubicin ABC transporter ATP-binding protein [Candidatus Aerophobetes bacterium Ae_b3a]
MSTIEVDKLTRKFKDLVAVDHISFKIEKGELFGLLGPNGAGKSTTIRMLCTLLRPTSGEAKVAGFEIVKEAGKVREHIGLVAEKIILYDRLTARENLKFFGRLNHIPTKTISERTRKLLELVKMEKWANTLAGTFSSGMKQRINLARALLNMPEILFLDEPTLGLDPQTTRAIRDFIKEINKEGITIILTTHIMQEADILCDRIGIIDQGKIVALDTPQNLKSAISQQGKTAFDLNISNPSAQIVSQIEELETVSSVSQENDYNLKIYVNSEEAIYEIMDVIKKNKITIKNITTLAPNLEDAFLHFTGHQMRDKAEEKISLHHHGHGGFRARSRVR